MRNVPGFTAPAVEIKDLFFEYEHEARILDSLSITISEGQKVGFIGPNGAGKTTLFMLISGVLKKQRGELKLFGNEVHPGRFNPDTGLVFQYSDDQLFSPTVRDDIAFGPTNLNLPRDEVDARVASAIGVAGIAHLANKPPHHLSGGEKRMVAIAGVLAMEPRLIMYDEPTSNLDIRSRRRLISFISSAGQTSLIASHDLEFILEVCERVALIDEGRIIAEGEARSVMSDRGLMEKHGLEMPHSLIKHVHLI